MNTVRKEIFEVKERIPSIGQKSKHGNWWNRMKGCKRTESALEKMKTGKCRGKGTGRSVATWIKKDVEEAEKRNKHRKETEKFTSNCTSNPYKYRQEIMRSFRVRKGKWKII